MMLHPSLPSGLAQASPLFQVQRSGAPNFLPPSSRLANRAQGIPLSRSRSKQLRDNNFAGASLSATLAPGYGSAAVVFNGRIDRRDPIDFFKVTLLPNASISNLFASRQTIRQAPLNFQMIGDIRGQRITLIGANFPVSDVPPQSYPVQPPLVNETGEPIELYFRFATVGRRESRYSLFFSFFQ